MLKRTDDKLSQVQSTFSGSIGEGFDSPVVPVFSAIKARFGDTRRQQSLGNQLTDLSRSIASPGSFPRQFAGPGCFDRVARRIMNRLDSTMQITAKHRKHEAH